jgi:predicted transcriptional regulator
MPTYVVDQKAIKKVLWEAGLSAIKTAEILHITAKAVHNKLNDPEGRLWKAHELATLASVTMVAPGTFYALKSA